MPADARVRWTRSPLVANRYRVACPGARVLVGTGERGWWWSLETRQVTVYSNRTYATALTAKRAALAMARRLRGRQGR